MEPNTDEIEDGASRAENRAEPSEEYFLLAVDELQKANLLARGDGPEPLSDMTRRAMLRKMVLPEQSTLIPRSPPLAATRLPQASACVAKKEWAAGQRRLLLGTSARTPPPTDA